MENSFVEIMGIAKRYKNELGDSKPDAWYLRLFQPPETQDDLMYMRSAEVHLLAWAAEHPERPRLTDEQRKVLEWLDAGGYVYVTLDDGGEIEAHDTEVHNATGAWFSSADDYSTVIGRKLDCLRPLIPDWTQPLDITAKLKEAGV